MDWSVDSSGHGCSRSLEVSRPPHGDHEGRFFIKMSNKAYRSFRINKIIFPHELKPISI